jgi:hypothetical protein
MKTKFLLLFIMEPGPLLLFKMESEMGINKNEDYIFLTVHDGTWPVVAVQNGT